MWFVRAFGFSVVLLATLFLGCTGRSHPQREGRYAFSTQEIFRDDCGFLLGPGTLWGGSLVITGNEVAMAYDLLNIRLVGRYREGLESFNLDGSTNAAEVSFSSRTCLADLLVVHLEGETESPDVFTGVLRVSTTGSNCECMLWTKFQAVHE
jgi:hypothetical protein